MNAGAYGGEVSEAVDAVEGVDASGAVHHLARPDVAFTYRRAALPTGFVVTGVRFRLRPESAETIRARLEQARERRIASQPHGWANAGSIFKNPPGDFAGRLVETAGLKGTRVGGARISEAHGNFIVNEGAARAADVQALMQEAQRVVWERSGVWLEPEVRLIGSW
jgi:UDP-N-acetylmuramate dehydrogenase